MTSRILVTGSREWADVWLIDRVLKVMSNSFMEDAVLVSGGCPTGADHIAEELWRGMGGQVEVHPADWDRYGKGAGPLRNLEMVKLGADLCLAFPLGESRGTRHCMAAAGRAGIIVLNYGDVA